jgi:peptide/nickel transport system substrate-binding protein
MMRRRSATTTRRALVAGLACLSLTVSACGGIKEGDLGSASLETKGLTAQAGEAHLAEAGTPVRGGKLTYGVEADSNDGFCLYKAQLAISGMMVVRTIYDTLTVPNAKGEFVPYLAKSLTHNATYDRWVIDLRPNIKFHDGTPLTAEVVKNNLDFYRGTAKGADGLLFTFVLMNIQDTTVTGPLQVTVTTKKPWVAFPSYLYGSSRMGIMAQAQLDNKDHCADKPIGTGPFVFESWETNVSFKAKRNPNYWQIAPDGKPYPYVDEIEFVPIPDGQVRNQALKAGDINVMHTSNTKDMLGPLYSDMKAGDNNMLVSEESAEVSFLQLNNSVPPFDDPNMRKALAMGSDRSQINLVTNLGGPTIANGPISPGTIGYTEDTGFPAVDVAKAKEIVKNYKGKKSFTLSATPDASVQALAQLIQARAKLLGVTVKIKTLDQASLVQAAISGDFQAMTFRNYPGGDPDSLYVWFYGGGNPVNFARFDDPEVNRLLDEGRSETDPTKRKAIYTALDKRMGSQVYGLWSWFTPWAVVPDTKVHGILGPPLPGADPSKPGPASTTDPSRKPSNGLATGHSLLGMWIDK